MNILPTESEERKQIPVYSGCIAYFPDAICAVASLSYQGNKKHSPGQPLRWDRSKSADHMDCLLRHSIDQLDKELDPIVEKTATAWRALAELQIAIEELKK